LRWRRQVHHLLAEPAAAAGLKQRLNSDKED
jgi:hypothetical protein